MKICAIPLEIKPNSPEDNLLTAAAALGRVEPDTDVVVLPELFTTGFERDKATAEALAETVGGKTMEAVRRWAQFFGFAIAGSFLARGEDGHLHNRAFFAEPSGETTYYDKRHLFILSAEDKTYTPGQALPPRIRFRGWDFALTVCFDLRFPVWCRSVPDRPYDILLVPANWPHSRAAQFKLLLAARAVENQGFTVGCNCLSPGDDSEYEPGDSAIYDNLGNPVHETRANGYLYALLDAERLRRGRERLPAYRVADRWTIEM
ncbi:MAG: nitrilase family protein [Duncaniella sp.]|nr:nitrilase family protein [Duncaniella sp.]